MQKISSYSMFFCICHPYSPVFHWVPVISLVIIYQQILLNTVSFISMGFSLIFQSLSIRPKRLEEDDSRGAWQLCSMIHTNWVSEVIYNPFTYMPPFANHFVPFYRTHLPSCQHPAASTEVTTHFLWQEDLISPQEQQVAGIRPDYPQSCFYNSG